MVSEKQVLRTIESLQGSGKTFAEFIAEIFKVNSLKFMWVMLMKM